MKLLRASVMLMLVLAFIATTANAAQFSSFGAGTFADGISGDGSTAVGWGPRSSSDALLWTGRGEMLNLGDLPGACCSSAIAASWNGEGVVGESSSEAFRWTEAGEMQGLGFLSGMVYSAATDISADGSSVVGTSYGNGATLDRPLEAFRWTDGVGMVGLGTLLGDTRSGARGISADGSVVVGSSSELGNNLWEAFRWTEGVGMVGLGTIPGDTRSQAYGVSADGSLVIGYSYSDDPSFEAFSWTEGSGMVGLGTLPGDTRSIAFGASADGSVVVGHSEGSSGGEEAFVWDETHGMRRVEDVLTAAGLDMTGWRLRYAKGVSDDGNVIAGWGVNPSGGEEAWMARLEPVPGDPDFNNDGQLNCTDIDALVAEIVAGANGSDFDLTGDGLVNIADLNEWRVQGGAANLPSGNPYLVADANLDGAVGGEDFIAWNDHKFTSVAAWCSGDFTADGTVDGQDFDLWNDNKFLSSDAVNAVPEPSAGVLLIAALIGLVGGRRH
jgi:probable HAF family extracellular repeat protein